LLDFQNKYFFIFSNFKGVFFVFLVSLGLEVLSCRAVSPNVLALGAGFSVLRLRQKKWS
jgi:hypothetical protein